MKCSWHVGASPARSVFVSTFPTTSNLLHMLTKWWSQKGVHLWLNRAMRRNTLLSSPRYVYTPCLLLVWTFGEHIKKEVFEHFFSIFSISSEGHLTSVNTVRLVLQSSTCFAAKNGSDSFPNSIIRECFQSGEAQLCVSTVRFMLLT